MTNLPEEVYQLDEILSTQLSYFSHFSCVLLSAAEVISLFKLLNVYSAWPETGVGLLKFISKVKPEPLDDDTEEFLPS